MKIEVSYSILLPVFPQTKLGKELLCSVPVRLPVSEPVSCSQLKEWQNLDRH